MKRALKTMIMLAVFYTFSLFSGTVLAKDPKKVVFLTWKPNQPEIWKLLIDNFHKENPQIRIHLQVAPHSSTEYHAIVTQRLKNRDQSVDVFFMDVVWPPEFANAEWALDLSSRFPNSDREKFLKGPIAANTYKGKVYGVPCYLAAGLFYYRKDLLKKYGLTPPANWDELLSHGKVILSGENDPSLHVYSAQFKQYEGLVCNMLEFIWGRGGNVLDPESGLSNLSHPDLILPTAFVRDHIIGAAAPRGVVNYEEPESLDLFIQGKAVFHRNWPYAWAVANNPANSRIAGKVGVGTLPVFGDHIPVSTLGGWQFGISRWSRQQDAAWQFIKFMTSHKSQEVLAIGAGLAPTRKSVYQSAEVLDKMPHLKAFLPVFERARPRPLSPVYPMISQELQRFFSRAISTKTSDLEKLAEEASRRINRVVRLGNFKE
ncbi:ABC transporter substrate-binding protein [Thermodesulfobacteriota bacterium]